MTIKWEPEMIIVDDVLECRVGHGEDGLTYLHSTHGAKYCYVGVGLEDTIRTAKGSTSFYRD